MAYEVEIKDLRDSADAARSAARQLEGYKPGKDLKGAAAGMPGAVSVATMTRVASDWSTELTSWAKAARGYGTTLDSNATQYELDDEAARAAFAPVGNER